VEQVVRLIRSKGVGVYFVTQNPIDVPDKVLAQLGNRLQHALRAFTPGDQKAVRAAAETFRPNPKLNTAQVIMELGKGEALVSFLEGGGTPTMVDRTMIRPPSARIGAITAEERKAVMAKSPLKGKYDTTIDPNSAFKILQKRLAGGVAPAPSRRTNTRFLYKSSGCAQVCRRCRHFAMLFYVSMEAGRRPVEWNQQARRPRRGSKGSLADRPESPILGRLTKPVR